MAELGLRLKLEMARLGFAEIMVDLDSRLGLVHFAEDLDLFNLDLDSFKAGLATSL